MQAARILRTHGRDISELDKFLEEVGLSEEDWNDWVRIEALKQVERFSTAPMDERSPRDMLEDLIATKRNVRPVEGPLYDLTELSKTHEHGPFSENYMLPAFVQVLFFPLPDRIRKLACRRRTVQTRHIDSTFE
jgi:hypothetical protein